MKCHEVPANPKPADLAEILAKFNLDQEIGNQAQVVDLAQFVDLMEGIVAKLASKWFKLVNLERSRRLVQPI